MLDGWVPGPGRVLSIHVWYPSPRSVCDELVKHVYALFLNPLTNFYCSHSILLIVFQHFFFLLGRKKLSSILIPVSENEGVGAYPVTRNARQQQEIRIGKKGHDWWPKRRPVAENREHTLSTHPWHKRPVTKNSELRTLVSYESPGRSFWIEARDWGSECKTVRSQASDREPATMC